MPRLIVAGDFPTFSKADPNGIGFTCIHPAPSQGYRRCGNPVNKADRGRAAHIRERILSSTINVTILRNDDDLRGYAELCCCVRWHRVMVVDERVMSQLVRKWQTELIDLRESERAASITAPGPYRAIQPPVVRTVTTRTTRSHTGRREEIVSNAPTITPTVTPSVIPTVTPSFEPYKTHNKVSTFDLVSMPLTEQQQESGHIYCCSRPSDPGLYKAGCTKSRTRTSLDQRVQRLQTCSGQDNPITLELSLQTINAYRTERLMHNELEGYRRRELRCLDPNCVKKHNEWFEVDVHLIKRVMSRWAQWMNQAKPYDDHGRLRQPWKDYCNDLQQEGTSITSSELYLAWLQGLVSSDDHDSASTSSYSSEDDDSSEQDAAQEHTTQAEASRSARQEQDINVHQCPICLDTMSRAARTTCGHDFCSDCIAQWFQTGNRCPMCRTELVDGEEVVVEIAEIPMQNATSSSRRAR